MTHVLIVSPDRVGKAMAGPAIRCWEMARILAAEGHQVCLAASTTDPVEGVGFRVVASDHETLIRESVASDVIVVQGLALLINPELKAAGSRLVIDLYDPVNLEVLELFHDHPWEERMEQHDAHRHAILDQLHSGDFFLCASEKQRDYWIGMLAGAGRVNPDTHDQDPLLRRLIDTVPFGTPAQPPTGTGTRVAKGVLPGIEEDARLVIWAGGVYNWFDPLSLLRAWPDVLERVPQARLLFMGMRHPNPDVPEMAMATKAIELSEALDLRDKSVHFNMGWVPYDQRQDFLLEAEVGVSMHFDHLETAFSFRTRILDYIWAGLPVVATEGDEFARMIESKGIGRVVKYQDPDSIASAIGDLLTDETLLAGCVAAVKSVQPQHTWETTLQALVRYCSDPWQAPDLRLSADLAEEMTRDALRTVGSILAPKAPIPRMLYFIRTEGLWPLLGRLVRTTRRRLGRGIAGV